MGWRVTWQVTCDTCDAVGPSGRGKDPERSAVLAALKKGWVVAVVHYTGLKAHLCPACSGRPRPDWWSEEE